MGREGGIPAVRIVLASVALLLPAGVLSAAIVDPPPSTNTAAGAPAPTRSTAPDQTTTSTVASVPSTSMAPQSASTVVLTTTAGKPLATGPPTTARAATTPTMAPARPPIRTIPVTPLFPTIAPATSWQADKNGVSVRMRLEPTTPVAGQPVRFVVDLSSADTCCLLFFSFDDGSGGVSNLAEACSGAEPLSPGASTFETTHVFTGPGTHLVTLAVDAGDKCPKPAPSGTAGTPSVIIEACVAIGPGTGQGTCSSRFRTR